MVVNYQLPVKNGKISKIYPHKHKRYLVQLKVKWNLNIVFSCSLGAYFDIHGINHQQQLSLNFKHIV